MSTNLTRECKQTAERVGHCKERNKVTFLPLPGDVRVCVHNPRVNVLDDATTFILLEVGDWFEFQYMEFVRSCLEPTANAVDVGANHGVYSLSIAKVIQKGGGRVWAFEPSTTTADRLETSRNINLFGNLTVLRLAVSDAPGTLKFTVGLGELNHLITEDSSPDVKTEEVEVTTLDACMEKYGWTAVDFIKIDVEGAELNVITGGARFFKELSPLVMFEVEHPEAGVGELVINHKIVSAFEALGYRIFRLVPALNTLMPLDMQMPFEVCSTLNLFACKPDCAARLASRGLAVLGNGPATEEPDYAADERAKAVFESLPYACALRERWQTHGAQRGTLDAALLAFFVSQDVSRNVETRFSALQYSYRQLRDLCNLEGGGEALRLQSLARVQYNYMPLPLRGGGDPKLFGTLVTRLVESGALAVVPALGSPPAARLVDTVAALDKALSEPFLAAAKRFDEQVLPTSGDLLYKKPEGVWAMRSLMEFFHMQKTLSVGFGSGAFMEEDEKEMQLLVLAGADGDCLHRRVQVVRASKGMEVVRPFFLQGRATDKLVGWLRRAIATRCPEPARGKAYSMWCEKEVLVTLSGCCDPPLCRSLP